MKKETEINVKVSCPELSGAIQRIALGNGYKWYSGKKEISQTDKAILCFNKNDKDMTYGGAPCSVYTLPQDWDKVVDFLKQKESSVERINKLFSEYHNRHNFRPGFMLIGAGVEDIIKQELLRNSTVNTYLDCKVIRSNDLKPDEIIFTS